MMTRYGEEWVDFATPENGVPEFGEESALFRQIFRFGGRIIFIAELPGCPLGVGNVFVAESGTFKFPGRGL